MGDTGSELKAERALAGFAFFLAILGRDSISSSSSVLESQLRAGKSESESTRVSANRSAVAAALLCGGARDVFTMVRARLGLDRDFWDALSRTELHEGDGIGTRDRLEASGRIGQISWGTTLGYEVRRRLGATSRL